MSHEADHLKQLMQSWTDVPSPAQGTTGAVWQTIRAREQSATASSMTSSWVRIIDSWLARPQTMAAVVAVALLVGMGLAEMRSQFEAAQIDHEMSVRYLSLLDPVAR